MGRTEKILHFIKHFKKSHFPENYGIFDKMEKSILVSNHKKIEFYLL